jgi:hypothetical protein
MPAFVFPFRGFTQMITGSWKGKINRQKVEVKIIQEGDSLKGTSYYFESHNNYRRYSIKGYFDPESNDAVWWDDQLIEERSSKFSIGSPGKIPSLTRANFNCPGGGRMMLDGKGYEKNNEDRQTGPVHLDKSNNPEFEDEWDYVIDNYTVGTNDPYLIDSIAALSGKPLPDLTVMDNRPVSTPVETPKQTPVIKKPEKQPDPVVLITRPKPVAIEKPTITEKFTSREKILVKDIPLVGDSLELRFYDNAEVDGDSISLFLNNKLIFEHIRLTAKAYIIKIPVDSMQQTNELIMVAENLGSIPPNTSYMLAISGGKRYDAFLASTEGSSAMIRFFKEKQ